MGDDHLRAGFAARGFDDVELRRTALTDPAVTAASDLRRVLESPVVSRQIAVSGHRYDVKTGRLTEVVAPIRAGAR
jgi:carbonic anhydrase